MIELRDVAVRTRKSITPVAFSGINLRVKKGDRLAILGPPNGGIALVTDVICGANAPDSGKVVRNGRISWPIPGTGFFHKHHSYVSNARFIARMYEMDQPTFISQVLDLADLGDLAHEQLSRCPKAVTSRFAFAIGACLPFDIYLFTKTSFGEKSDRERYNGVIEDIASRNGLLIAGSSSKGGVQEFCDKAYVLDPAGCVYYDDMDEAAEHLARISKRGEAADEDITGEEDERPFDDFF